MSKRYNRDYGWVFGLFVLGFVTVAAISWVKNVYEFTQCDFESPYKCEFIRVVGIPMAPVGAVVGFMDLGQ